MLSNLCAFNIAEHTMNRSFSRLHKEKCIDPTIHYLNIAFNMAMNLNCRNSECNSCLCSLTCESELLMTKAWDVSALCHVR